MMSNPTFGCLPTGILTLRVGTQCGVPWYEYGIPLRNRITLKWLWHGKPAANSFWTAKEPLWKPCSLSIQNYHWSQEQLDFCLPMDLNIAYMICNRYDVKTKHFTKTHSNTRLCLLQSLHCEYYRFTHFYTHYTMSSRMSYNAKLTLPLDR